MAHTAITSTSILAPGAAAFRFVSRLADELSHGQLDLPALPEVVMRVKRALADEQVSSVVVARLVATEPGLAARVMTLANSVIMNPSGAPITELRTAVTRIGHHNVRSTSIAYAIAKLRQSADLTGIREQMESLWQDALCGAALAYAVANVANRRGNKLNADEAMLVGLVHNIGKIYILSRAHRYAQLFVSDEDTANIMREWHIHVGRAIVESWGFAHVLVQAVNDHDDPRPQQRVPDLGDALGVAVRMRPVLRPAASPEAGWQLPDGLVDFAPLSRLGLDIDDLRRITLDATQVLGALRGALGS